MHAERKLALEGIDLEALFFEAINEFFEREALSLSLNLISVITMVSKRFDKHGEAMGGWYCHNFSRYVPTRKTN